MCSCVAISRFSRFRVSRFSCVRLFAFSNFRVLLLFRFSFFAFPSFQVFVPLCFDALEFHVFVKVSCFRAFELCRCHVSVFSTLHAFEFLRCCILLFSSFVFCAFLFSRFWIFALLCFRVLVLLSFTFRISAIRIFSHSFFGSLDLWFRTAYWNFTSSDARDNKCRGPAFAISWNSRPSKLEALDTIKKSSKDFRIVLIFKWMCSHEDGFI